MSDIGIRFDGLSRLSRHDSNSSRSGIPGGRMGKIQKQTLRTRQHFCHEQHHWRCLKAIILSSDFSRRYSKCLAKLRHIAQPSFDGGSGFGMTGCRAQCFLGFQSLRYALDDRYQRRRRQVRC